MIPPILCTRRLAGHPALDYVEQGDLTGIPVIALHGVTDSWRSFQPLLPHLSPKLRLFALSQRGHGDSERLAQGQRPRDFAHDVLRLMDTLGLPRAVIVGHSMGGVNALRFAIDHPQRVLGLMLAGAVPAFGANAELVDWWRGELDRIDAPVLLVRGSRDTICAEVDQLQLATAIRGARLKNYDGAGHAMHWEQPQRFASDLNAFALGAAAVAPPHLETAAA